MILSQIDPVLTWAQIFSNIAITIKNKTNCDKSVCQYRAHPQLDPTIQLLQSINVLKQAILTGGTCCCGVAGVASPVAGAIRDPTGPGCGSTPRLFTISINSLAPASRAATAAAKLAVPVTVQIMLSIQFTLFSKNVNQ